VAVASAWLYASLHLIPDNHANIPPVRSSGNVIIPQMVCFCTVQQLHKCRN